MWFFPSVVSKMSANEILGWRLEGYFVDILIRMKIKSSVLGFFLNSSHTEYYFTKPTMYASCQ